jgi:hypothetical protein
MEIAKAGEAPEVVLEATYGYYWLVDLLKEAGANVHVAHPSGLRWEGRRVRRYRLGRQEYKLRDKRQRWRLR